MFAGCDINRCDFCGFFCDPQKRLPAKIFSEKINSAGKIIHAIMT